ncbi:unnamed protein product [Heligmosomoides polygyrus]|uniref:Thrombospondin type-1 domain-containing protein 1 n=1 Tax=Heligmosomoides polygyrus TaxID=6339 RepID=A0A3P7XTM3_HELPZ|nr:unnamed protein product [Heligmosomoides polygyrus]
MQTDKLILVNETTRFALQLRNDSIFPHCVKDFSLQWKTANCEAAALNYRIRVLAVQEGDETHEHRSHYIEDIALSTEEKTVKIGCFLFDIFYKKYCFELMSIEAVSGAYHLWRRSCVNTEPTSRAEAKWTRWSSWSECTSTCGESVQKRHRYCENSKLNQGAPCEGDVLETRPCPSSGIKCTDVTPSFTNLGNCTCGCEMTGTSGIFFATAADSELCSGNQTWSMTARSEHLVSDFKIIADVGAPGKLFFFVGAPYEELVWFSGSSQEQDFTLSIDRPIFIVLWHKGNRSILEHRKGFSIAYSTREVLPQFPVSTAASVCQPLCPETLFIGTLAIMFILIIFVPPFVCASIIQRLRRHTVQELSLSGKLHDEEMVRSGNTDCTQVSGVKPPCLAQRSIGVQLSVQSTPRLPRSRLPNEPPLARGTSSMSTSDELEYDYYDGSTIPGSLLAPLPNHMLSEIDIDQIIAQSLLFSGGGDGDETRDV